MSARSLFVALALIPAVCVPAFAGDCASKSKTAAWRPHDAAKTASAAESSNIVETAQRAGQFETLLAAATAAGLAQTLANDGPFTVFAPTDDAFAKLPAGVLDDLLKPENKARLVEILTYHVVAGEVRAADLAGKVTTAETLGGAKLIANGISGVKVNDAAVLQADVEAANGVVHVIDAVLLPPIG